MLRLVGYHTSQAPDDKLVASLAVASLRATVTTLPGAGALRQLSKVFSDRGLEPKKGPKIDANNTVVTGSRNRLLYDAPAPHSVAAAGGGALARFEYVVDEGDYPGARASRPGTVTVVAPGGALVASSFDASDEGWQVARNGAAAAAPRHEPGSWQRLNQYIHATDALINLEVDEDGHLGRELRDRDRVRRDVAQRLVDERRERDGRVG